MVKTVIRNSLEVLKIDMEKDVQKLRKNACQKDIREKCLLFWNKMEKEFLDPRDS